MQFHKTLCLNLLGCLELKLDPTCIQGETYCFYQQQKWENSRSVCMRHHLATNCVCSPFIPQPPPQTLHTHPPTHTHKYVSFHIIFTLLPLQCHDSCLKARHLPEKETWYDPALVQTS